MSTTTRLQNQQLPPASIMPTKEAGKVARKLIEEVERFFTAEESEDRHDAGQRLRALLPEAKRAAHALTHRFP